MSRIASSNKMTNNQQDNPTPPPTPPFGYILTLLRDIPVVSAMPTDPPQNAVSMALYDDGTNRRVLFYFNGAWRYVALT